MADPDLQPLQNGPEILASAAIPFRFEVTWRSLIAPLGPTGATSVAITRPAKRASPRDTEAREWEMVLPRMQRPVQLPASALEPPVPGHDEAGSPRIPLPTLRFAYSDRGSRRWMFVAGAALLAPLAFATFRWTEQRSQPILENTTTLQMGGAGWISEWASDPTGSARGRQISLYRPSIAMSDYRLEFVGRIERKSLGWVFRAADSRNYYSGKLEASPSGLIITHFAVIHGIEGPHIQKPLPLSPGAGPFRVRLDASGPRFTAYVQNQVVEDWEDDRLKTGGVGFLNEREERGQIESVKISFLKGGQS